VLAKCWWIEGSILLVGLLTNILLFPLAQGLDQWGQGVKNQVAALLALPGTRPITFSVGIIIVLLLSIAGKLADRALKHDEEEKRQQQHLATTKHAMTQVVGEPLKRLADDVAEVRQGVKNLTSQPAILPPGVIAPTGLPRAVSLIGRDEVLVDLMAKLRAGDTIGVFALEGMGGVGKTALAAEIVARLAEDSAAFPGGAAWIACEGLEGEAGQADLWARVARALGLEQVAALPNPQARRAALGTALAQQKRLLLALDNLEPGLDADAALDTLSVRGHTALLLTARQKVAPLRLRAVELPPLPPPDGASLFRQRLGQIDAARPTAEDEPAIPALLAAVGGLPLAIELTAAYAGMQRLALERMLRELEQDGLNAAAYRADPKRALPVRFERSWLALAPRRQRLFAGLALLAGASFPREAALAVAQATLAKRTTDPQGDLLTLVSYALVEALPGGERLRLHPLLREYAAGKLKTLPQAQQERLGDAMVAYWLVYAEAHPGYESMDALEAEAAGLMGALAWAHEHAQHREVLGLAHALNKAWYVRGRRDEEIRMYSWAKMAAEQSGDTREMWWMVHSLAVKYWQLGQIQEARAGYERALALARQLGNPAAERIEVHSLAVLDWQTGRLAEARAGYERALALARQQGNPAAERDEVHALAVLDDQTGRLAEARAGYERALELARQLADPAAESMELRNLGVFIGQRGEPVQGREMIAEALAISERLSDVYNIGKAHQFLAWLDRDEGNRAGAIAHYREALRRFEQVQSPDAEDVRADLRRLGAKG
jgi:tetratricopeptide (TPR) repeat protein